MCSFNARNKEEVVAGFKNKISLEEAYTGIELCKLLGIDFYEITKIRKNHQNDNIHYFIKSLLEIDEVKKRIIKELKILGYNCI